MTAPASPARVERRGSRSTPDRSRGSAPPLHFALPPDRRADRPPEARGLARDEVRLIVSTGGTERIEHARFRTLPDLLAPGDLLVANDSATLPAAVPARRAAGGRVEVRFSTHAPQLGDGDAPQLDGGEWWVIELRSADGTRPFRGRAAAGERLALPAGARAELVAPYLGDRLWLARFGAAEPTHAYLARHGHPIRYGYLSGRWPLEAYQTVFAREPGSAEMPSAGRPFTAALVTRLIARGIQVAPITLHAGVSSPERDESPYPERYAVPEATARTVNAARRSGRRVIAVGTTVVRALETVAGPDGEVVAGEGWTDLVITPGRGVRAVDGLLTGLHEPTSPHLDLLSAVGGRSLVERSYAEALRGEYLWHEFGDSHLILPANDDRRRNR